MVRIVNDLRDRQSSGQVNHRPERHPFPDIGNDVGAEREPAVVEPDRAVDAEQLRQYPVDQAQLADQHPVD